MRASAAPPAAPAAPAAPRAAPRGASYLARAWPALGLIAVLLCAAVTLRGQWAGEEASSGAPPQRSALSTPSALLPPQAPGALDAAARGDAAVDRSAAAVLERVSAVGERARRVAPAPEQAVSAEALHASLGRLPHPPHPSQNPAAAAPPAGTRVRVQGRLEGVELGEAGVVVLRLALPGRTQGLRLVASPAWAERAAAWAEPGASTPELSLDCLSQGVMMGEWLLVDCQG